MYPVIGVTFIGSYYRYFALISGNDTAGDGVGGDPGGGGASSAPLAGPFLSGGILRRVLSSVSSFSLLRSRLFLSVSAPLLLLLLRFIVSSSSSSVASVYRIRLFSDSFPSPFVLICSSSSSFLLRLRHLLLLFIMPSFCFIFVLLFHLIIAFFIP